MHSLVTLMALYLLLSLERIVTRVIQEGTVMMIAVSRSCDS